MAAAFARHHVYRWTRILMADRDVDAALSYRGTSRSASHQQRGARLPTAGS